MSLPVVVIVGRPNVGKSSLLNMLAREPISIVDPRAGITRDRVSAMVELDDRWFELIDTGGIGMVDDQQLEEHVHRQIDFAIHRADVVLCVVDVQQGITTVDAKIAEKLRKLNLDVILVANKADHVAHEGLAGEFAALGFGDALPVSALHANGRRALLEVILERLGDAAGGQLEMPVMKLAIVGKRNAGKSTLVNALAGEERMIVSEIPGTTRDAVDVEFVKDGRRFIAIDTAGVRKRKSMDDIDFYSYVRAERSIQRADVVAHLIDATVPVSEVDLKLAEVVERELRPYLIVVNKWDLAKGKATADDFGDYLSKVMPSMSYAPITFATARESKNIDAVVDVALGLHKQAQTRVSTAKLNRALEAVVALRGPSAKSGTRPVKIYYGTQVSVAPPTIVFSCNRAEDVTENYRRFLENRLRELLPFREVPMRLHFRSHRKAEAGGEARRKVESPPPPRSGANPKRLGPTKRSGRR